MMSYLSTPLLLPNKNIIPVAFIENKGQIDENIQFYIKQCGTTTFLASDGMTVILTGQDYRVALKSVYVNASPSNRLIGQEMLTGKMHYLLGNQFEKHRTDVSQFSALYQTDVWPGIDLSIRYTDKGLKRDWIIQSGANPNDIEVKWIGMEKIFIDESGDLIVSHALSELREEYPYCYQQRGEEVIPIICKYNLNGDGYGFELGPYDKSLPLIIDPPIQYSSYIGGSSNDYCYGIAVDLQGQAYVVGETQSTNFPTTVGSFQPDFKGTVNQAFVAKVSPDFSTLIYCTFLGGNYDDGGAAVVVDDAGYAYVVGNTFSDDFPVTPGAFQTTFHGGVDLSDAFITKLSPGGNSLVFSTYLGGSGQELIQRQQVAFDADGFVYVSGTTTSADFQITPGAFQTVRPGTQSAFISKLTPTADALVFSTYLGGNGGIGKSAPFVLGADGYIHVAGTTTSPSFPTTVGAFQRTYGGGTADGFVCKMAPTGDSIVYSTYLGGNGQDELYYISLDATGSTYVGGLTTSTNYPTTPNVVQSTAPAAQNAMVTRLTSDGSALIASTYLGGSNVDVSTGGKLHSNGNIYVVGETNSTNFPVTPMNPPTNPSGSMAFVSVLDPLFTELVVSFYFGGGTSATSQATSIAINSTGVYVAGYTNSAEFEVSANAFQPNFRGGTADGFVIKLSDLFTASQASMTVIKLN